jgi:AhpC/TSA family
MTKPLVENKLFAAILAGSALLNIGLAYKVHQQQRTLLALQGDRHENVLGLAVDHLDVTSLDGKPTTIFFTKADPPTLLYVFRPTCGWCAKNMPNLQAMEEFAPARHFRLIGISLDDHDLKTYVDNSHLTIPVYSNVDPSERVRLEMGGTPQTLLITNGTVIRDWEGAYMPDLQKEIESTLGIKLPGMSTTPPMHL